MGIASFSHSPVLSILLAPLQALAALLVPAQAASASPPSPSGHARQPCRPVPPFTTGKASALRRPVLAASKPCKAASHPTASSRLRILRQFEPGISPACAGRMVISGRMADVCAELDRMAQREATAH
ncbi:hypothetical protein [Polaromonas sp.]|uniref:hypothetical protein n=1 Tax=Polaromonas sp. TaxID=1869339 RepID=UPI002FC82521